jgi:hypothetical protein
MSKFKTNEDRLNNLEKRGQLIKESFQREFNKIKRVDESRNEIGNISGMMQQVLLTLNKGTDTKVSQLCNAKHGINNTIVEWCSGSFNKGKMDDMDGFFIVINGKQFYLKTIWNGDVDLIQKGYDDPGDKWTPPDSEPNIWGFDDIELGRALLSTDETYNDDSAHIDVTQEIKAIGLDGLLKAYLFDDEDSNLQQEIDEYMNDGDYGQDGDPYYDRHEDNERDDYIN